ncbi:ABC transporter permease [Gryllotalpicola ginsengisoli]|uniref:ABC transporter permease n=1 Tax=Gryllotalpicola ginsengisoli TaxID=444608 RepID=UPI0003B4F043|nr:ABC transporter permease subunit [Gryllotalpicola ginsengisoli]
MSTELDHELGESIALDAETARGRGRARMLGSMRSAPPWAGAIVGIVLIVLVWWAISAIFFARSQAVPYPSSVAVALVRDLADPVFWSAIGNTAAAAGWGYLWGNVIAFALAFLVLLVPWLDGLATQLAVVCSCVPLTAIGPIVAIMTQVGSHATSIFLAAISVVFTSVVGALLGLRAASRSQLDLVRAYGGGALTELIKVRLVAALPSIFAALKIAAPAAFLGSVLGEYYLLNVDSGLGIQLLAAQSDNASVRLWALAFTCAGVAGFAYWAIGAIGRLVSPWSSGEAR